jgi:hypothetical protein
VTTATNNQQLRPAGGIVSGRKEYDMLYIYYKDETGTYLIEEIMTNRSITVDEALEIAGVDMDQWADAKGWDGYDWNCITLSYKKGLETMIGRFEGENSYFIGDYKIVNEIADSELWIYKLDEDTEDYEHYDTIQMPDFWVDYLYNAETADAAIEKAFEDYIRQELSI